MALNLNQTIETNLKSIKLQVKDQIGQGGQGSVFLVEAGRTTYALKWYNKTFLSKEQKEQIKNLIDTLEEAESLRNNKSFVWPIDYVELDDGFGYIMEYVSSKEFPSTNHLMSGKRGVTLSNLLKIANNLIDAFNILHREGLVYADISFNNIHIQPETGKIKIIDNDNVVHNGAEIKIIGTAGFNAPELVTRAKSSPTADTDKYSLSVLLFYLFFRGHPLNGAKEAKIRVFDEAAQKLLYGKEPIFIFDPQNKSNRPVEGIHDNVVYYWNFYPDFFKEAFIRSFTNGLFNVADRLQESEWKYYIRHLNDHLIRCKCSAELFANPNSKCWHCKRENDKMFYLQIDNHISTPLLNGKKIFQWHISRNSADNSPVGKIVPHPKKKGIFGLQNLTENTWEVIGSSGSISKVEPQKSALLKENNIIDFGTKKGKLVIR